MAPNAPGDYPAWEETAPWHTPRASDDAELLDASFYAGLVLQRCREEPGSPVQFAILVSSEEKQDEDLHATVWSRLRVCEP
jgi:hypothetical protein